MAIPRHDINPRHEVNPLFEELASFNENTWISMGTLAETMGQHEMAFQYYTHATRHATPYSQESFLKLASLCRGMGRFPEAVKYYEGALPQLRHDKLAEALAALGHCYLMMDNPAEAHAKYQDALAYPQNKQDPKLWYGIGILYDRQGSLEHALDAFLKVLHFDSKFEKASEIYFRLGIIYKQQQKFDLSLEHFQHILHSPPRPLTESDIWFQIGHVYEQKKEYDLAKEAYERVLKGWPKHAKVLQQLGWLYHQPHTEFCNQALAITYLEESLKEDDSDAQTWYLLGRCFMAEQNYSKAYESYQQAVYRDASNPTFWCSIGVLYYQINQYRDALDAYSRAIRLNPRISEVWYNLGTLYESCNNQTQDALDAYERALELDPSTDHIRQRLELLRTQRLDGRIPPPRDVSDPSQYQGMQREPGEERRSMAHHSHPVAGREPPTSSHRPSHPGPSAIHSPYPTAPHDSRPSGPRIQDIHHGRPAAMDHENRLNARYGEHDLPPMAHRPHPGSPRPSVPAHIHGPPPRSDPVGDNHDESAADMLLSIGRSGSLSGHGGLDTAMNTHKRRFPTSAAEPDEAKRPRLPSPPFPPPSARNRHSEEASRVTSPPHPHSPPSSTTAGSAQPVD